MLNQIIKIAVESDGFMKSFHKYVKNYHDIGKNCAELLYFNIFQFFKGP